MFFFGADDFERKEKGSLPGCWISCDSRRRRERTSLSAFLKGSLTLEAACVLPVFLYAVVVFLYFFQMIDIAGCVAEGMQDAGKQMAVYACMKEEGDGAEGVQAADIVSLLYAKNRIRQAADRQIPQLSLMRSSLLEGDEVIDLIAEYRFRWRIPLFFLSDVPVVQRARIRAWTGSRREEAGKEETDDGTYVYVTVNGSVYHRDRACSHIRLSVRTARKSLIPKLRNADGGRYYPCESCGGGNGGVVYITDTGDRYHGSAACSRLKRGVIKVPLSQVENWQPCARCGK